MATVVGDLLVKLSASDNELTAKLAQASTKLKGFGDKMKKVGQSMSLYLTAPMVLAGGASIKMASNFSESLNKVDVAFKSSASDVKKWSETTLKSFGIAQGTALDMAALFGDMATSMGLSTGASAKMSKELVGLAGDLASFKNIGIDEASTALKSIFTGETESLKNLGIVMTEVNLKAFALSKGFKTQYEKMSETEKVSLRFQYVMAKTANAQGDFARTSGGAANQSRMFGEQMKELGVQFGQIMLPLFTKILTAINGWIEKFKGLDDSTKKVILVVAGLAAVIGPLLLAIGFFTSNVLPLLIAGGTAFASAWLPITAVIIGVVAAIKLFNSEAETTTQAIKRLGEASDENISKLEERRASLRKLLKASQENKLDIFSGESIKKANEIAKQAEILGVVKKDNESFVSAVARELKAVNTVIAKYDKKKNAEKESAAVAVETEEEKATSIQRTIGLINNLEKEISELGIKQKEALNPADVKKYGDRIEELQNRIERVKAGRNPVGQDAGTFAQVKGLPAKVDIPVVLNPKVETKSIEEVNKKIEITSNLMRDLATEGISTLAESIGSALGGGGLKSALDNILFMLADFASQFGKTLIEAGTAVLIAQTQLAVNPIGAIVAGGVLVAAAAAIKASASKGMGGGGSGSAGVGRGSGGSGNLEGWRTLREDFVVQVNGTLTGKGKDLVAVINNEGVRKGL